MAITKLPLTSPTLADRTQPREELDYSVVDEYAELMNAGVEFPPIVVVKSGATHHLSDGWHRVEAAKKAGLKSLPANITKGTLDDAILYACGANTDHGLRRTPADKRRAVTVLLRDKEWSKWSDRRIAQHCGVTHPFVAKIRSELTGNDSSQTTRRRGADGRTIETANIGRKPVGEIIELDPEPPAESNEPGGLATLVADVAESRASVGDALSADALASLRDEAVASEMPLTREELGRRYIDAAAGLVAYNSMFLESGPLDRMVARMERIVQQVAKIPDMDRSPDVLEAVQHKLQAYINSEQDDEVAS